MSQTFLLEPDIIAATENVMPDLNNDLVLAKNFLKQQSAASGDSLYDHLVDVVHKILSQKPPDVVDNFEQYSWQVKQEKFRPNFDLLNDIYLSPPQLSLVRRGDEMFRLVASKAQKANEIGEEEQELDLEEDNVKPRISDLIDHNFYFRQIEVKQLKKLWQNIKSRALEMQRKRISNGDASEQSQIGQTEEQVMSVMPSVVPTIEYVPVDSDGVTIGRDSSSDNDSAYWHHKRSKYDTNDLVGEESIKREIDTELRGENFKGLKKKLLRQQLNIQKKKADMELKHIEEKNRLEIKFINSRNKLELEILELRKQLLKKDLGGYGLPESECYAVYISLNMLAIKEPVSSVRFFGKIYGTKANYYVAETDLTLEELDRRIREFDLKDMPGEDEGMEEARIHEAEEQREIMGEGEAKEEKPKEPVRPKLPPEPVSTWQPPPPIPVERPGQGVNKKVFWVCNNPGEQWICLPDLKPEQIRVARLTVRCMRGDLDAEVQTFPPFDGTERNYLRAQIARIQAATSISPQGFYTYGSGEEEEDIDLEEGGGDLDFNPNPFYQGHTLKDLLDRNLTYWVHHGRHILKQGRTIWWNPNAGMEEGLEEEEDEGPPPVEPEVGPPLFTSLSEDARVEGVGAWSPRCSSALTPDRALVVLRSNLWPGAVAYATSGKKSECMYIGWVLKYQPPNFSPLQLPRPQDEYIIGPEVMEMADPTFADEEAYRIAHLPPPPPPVMLGEGEGFGEEEEDEN